MPENQKCSRKASPPPVVMHREATDKATRLPAFLEMTRGPGGGEGRLVRKAFRVGRTTEWFLRCSEGKKVGPR